METPVTENSDVTECKESSPETKVVLIWLFVGLAVVGMVGNVYSIALLSGGRRRQKKILSDVYKIFIIALAIADSGMLFFTGVLRYAVVDWMYETGRSSWVYEVHLCRWHRFLMHAFHNAAVWLLVVMTFDRFLAVCFPFTYREFNHNSINAKKVTGVVFFLSFLCATPFLAVGPVYSDVTEHAPLFNQSGATFDMTSLANASSAPNAAVTSPEATPGRERALVGCSLTANLPEEGAYVINIIFHVLLAFLVPYFALLLLNAVIFRSLHCNRGGTPRIGSRHRMNRKITVMMLVVCCTFIVLWLPQALILMTSSDAHSHNCESDEVLTSLAALSGLTNSALNFFLYCMTVKKFRDAAWESVAGRTCVKVSDKSMSSFQLRGTTRRSQTEFNPGSQRENPDSPKPNSKLLSPDANGVAKNSEISDNAAREKDIPFKSRYNDISS